MKLQWPLRTWTCVVASSSELVGTSACTSGISWLQNRSRTNISSKANAEPTANPTFAGVPYFTISAWICNGEGGLTLANFGQGQDGEGSCVGNMMVTTTKACVSGRCGQDGRRGGVTQNWAIVEVVSGCLGLGFGPGTKARSPVREQLHLS